MFKQECQTDTKYARRICDIFKCNDNIFGSKIFDLESRYIMHSNIFTKFDKDRMKTL